MKPKDIFHLAVRLLGLVFFYLGVRSAVGVWYAHGSGITPPILTAVCYLGVAWWLVGGAPLFMDRAYPEADSAP